MGYRLKSGDGVVYGGEFSGGQVEVVMCTGEADLAEVHAAAEWLPR